MSSYSQANGLNLWMHSHEFLFPSCTLNLRLHSHESYPPAKFLESFGWVPSMSCHHDSGMPLESHRMRPERDFGCTPYNHTWVPLKSIVERFRCLLRDFRFWANFSIFRIEKILIFDALERIKEKRRMDSTSHPPLWSSQNGSGMTK